MTKANKKEEEVTQLDVEIGRRLSEFRKRNHISQEDFGTVMFPDMDVKTAQKTISHCENGRRKITATELLAIASSYKINLNWLITGIEEAEGKTINEKIESIDDKLDKVLSSINSETKHLMTFMRQQLIEVAEKAEEANRKSQKALDSAKKSK